MELLSAFTGTFKIGTRRMQNQVHQIECKDKLYCKVLQFEDAVHAREVLE